MIGFIKTLLQIRIKNTRKWVLFNIILVLSFVIVGYMEFTGEMLPYTNFFTLRNYNPQRIIKITPRISKPFTDNEFVSGLQCMLFVVLVPPLLLTIAHYDEDFEFEFEMLTNSSSSSSSPRKPGRDYYNVFNVVNSYAMLLFINGFITNFCKIIISNPRPDFLSRCNIPKKDLTGEIQDITLSQCTTPLTDFTIVDGLRSTPSGHSSFVTLAMCVVFQYLHNPSMNNASNEGLKFWNKLKLNCWCLIVIAIVVYSRILDHRHHLEDTVFGILIGWIVGFYGLKKLPKYFDIYTVKRKQQLPL